MELGMGTIPFFGLNCLLVCMVNFMYLGIAQILYSISPSDFIALYRQTYAVGYSGVLFGLLVVDTQNTPDIDRVFCCCPIPAWLYPWVLFLMIQIALPDVSWLGHLSGILVGYMYSKGLFNWLTMTIDGIKGIEALPRMQRLVTYPRFAACPDHAFISNAQLPWTSGWVGACCSGNCFARCCNWVNNVGSNLNRGRHELGQRLGNLPGRGGRQGNGYSRVDDQSGHRLGDMDDEGGDEDFQPGLYAAPVGTQVEVASQPGEKRPPPGLNRLLNNVPRATSSEKKMREDRLKEESRKAQSKAVNSRLVNHQAPGSNAAVESGQAMDTVNTGAAEVVIDLNDVPALEPPPEDVAFGAAQQQQEMDVQIQVQEELETHSSDDDIYDD